MPVVTTIKLTGDNHQDVDLVCQQIKAISDENSWVLVRKSNTENAIRISAETNSLEKVTNIDQ